MAKEGEPLNRGIDFRAYSKIDGRFDKEMQMFCEAPREPDLDRLRFLRWLAEQGKLEHGTFGPSVGEFELLERLDRLNREPAIIR